MYHKVESTKFQNFENNFGKKGFLLVLFEFCYLGNFYSGNEKVQSSKFLYESVQTSTAVMSQTQMTPRIVQAGVCTLWKWITFVFIRDEAFQFWVTHLGVPFLESKCRSLSIRDKLLVRFLSAFATDSGASSPSVISFSMIEQISGVSAVSSSSSYIFPQYRQCQHVSPNTVAPNIRSWIIEAGRFPGPRDSTGISYGLICVSKRPQLTH